MSELTFCAVKPEYVSQSQRAFERRLHLHVPQLGNRDIQMRQRLRACGVRLVFQQKLGQPQVRQGKFGTKADLAGGFQSLRVVRARRCAVAHQYRGISQMARYARLEGGARDGQVSNAVEARHSVHWLRVGGQQRLRPREG